MFFEGRCQNRIFLNYIYIVIVQVLKGSYYFIYYLKLCSFIIVYYVVGEIIVWRIQIYLGIYIYK